MNAFSFKCALHNQLVVITWTLELEVTILILILNILVAMVMVVFLGSCYLEME